MDVVADLGLAITFTAGLDSRFFFTAEPLGWTSTTDALQVEGDRMLTRNEDAMAFVFDGDGTPEPAMVDVVPVRR